METETIVPASGDGAPVVENPAPVTTETPAAEGAAPAEPAAPEITEPVLAAAAEKFAAAKIKAANQTMAAARRAEKATGEVRQELATVKTELAEYKGFVEQVRTSPSAALQRLGYTVKSFLDHLRNTDGGEKPPETVEERLARIEQERATAQAGGQQAATAAQVAASQRKVFEAVDKDPRFDLATTDIGHTMLWDAIEAYHAQHKSCPDAAVFALAARVEKQLETNVARTRKFSGQRPAATQNGATPAAQAAPAGTNGGNNTLTNASTSGAPAPRVYSLDPEERRRQVNEDMRQAGELS